MANTSLNHQHLETIEVETRPQPSHAVIWLHGLGADASDMVQLMEHLELPALGIRFVFPNAPMMPVTINGGFVMRAWYDILDGSLALRQEDAQGLRRSQAQIAALLEREVSRGVPASHIVLAGFSQGGAVSLQTGLRYPHKLAGMLVISGYLPLMALLEQEREPVNQLTPVFMGHGKFDDIVPISLAAATRERLTRTGYPVDWHESSIAHGVCDEELADIGGWLAKVLS